LPVAGEQLLRPMLNGVRPAHEPAEASVLLDTVGKVTVKSLPPVPLPLMSQVCPVMLPLKVIVPSAARAVSGESISAPMATATVEARIVIFTGVSLKECH
jgi:hypothetical protein